MTPTCGSLPWDQRRRHLCQSQAGRSDRDDDGQDRQRPHRDVGQRVPAEGSAASGPLELGTRDCRQEHGDEMFVFDWASLAEKNPKWIAEDQIHCTNRGYEQRARRLPRNAILRPQRDAHRAIAPTVVEGSRRAGDDKLSSSVSSPSECLPRPRGARKHSDGGEVSCAA